MRLHRLDLNLLIMLEIMMDEKSVSQTAQRLNMTQPAISNALSRLRQHFDDDLFVVMGRRMVPTPLCTQLMDPVRKVVAELAAIATARAKFDPATAQRSVTIVCSDYVFLVFLSSAIRKLETAAPGLSIRTLLTNESMGEFLRTGRADFGIFPDHRLIEGLPDTPLFADRFSVISWNENRHTKAGLSAQKYLALSHVSTSIGPLTPPHIEQESLDQHGVERHIAVFAPNFTSVGEVVAGTNYIATVHARSAKILAQRLPLRIQKPPYEIAAFNVCLQWSPSREADAGLIWLKDFFLGCGAEMGPG